MRLLLTLLAFVLLALPGSGLAQSSGLSGLSDTLTGVQGAVDQVGGVVGQVGGIVSDIESIGNGGGNFSGGESSSNSGMFNPDAVFPAWGEGGQVTGVIGTNNGALNQGESRLIIYFIPKIIELMIWIVAPIITVMFIYAGLQFIWGGDREEEVKKSRDFFRGAVIGLIFIVLSYSLMKAVFFILV